MPCAAIPLSVICRVYLAMNKCLSFLKRLHMRWFIFWDSCEASKQASLPSTNSLFMLTTCIPFLLCFELITDMYLAKIFIQVESKNFDIKMMLGVGTSFAAHSSCSSPDHTSRARESQGS
ncbi:hypothetical protein Peur_063184 [Populus x canadensis]